MNKVKLLEMVRKIADKDKIDPLCSQGDFVTLTIPEIERFAKLIAADEREECAKVCEETSEYSFTTLGEIMAIDCAKAIRARGEVK